MPDPNTDETKQAKIKSLHQECALSPWQDLQRFFASGQTIYIAKELDLLEVAYDFSLDNSEEIEVHIKQNQIKAVPDKLALEWIENKTSLWTIVIKPWVLVQEQKVQEQKVQEQKTQEKI